MQRYNLNTNEQAARKIVGTDSEAIFTTNNSTAEDLLKNEKAAKFNEQVQAMENKLSSYMDTIEEQTKEMAKDLNGVDIMPMFGYVLVRPFEQNPFQKIKMSESGILLDTGGMAKEYKSEEDGNIHEEQEIIKVGMVVETGHKCEFLKKGDLVFYNNMASAIPVPFYRLGLIAVNEQRIIAAVNDNLSSRKEKLMNHGN